MFTVDAIISLMKLRAGVSSALSLPQGITWYDILNLAGMEFFTAHTWSWLEQEATDVIGRSGEDFLRLPRDYVSKVTAAAQNAGVQAIRSVGIEKITHLRSYETLTGAGFAEWCICWSGPTLAQDSPTGQPYHKAPIWPACSADGEPTIRLVYERGWSPIGPNDGATIIKVAPHCEAAFIQCCKCAAWENTHRDPAHDRPLYRALLEEAIAKDEAANPRVDNPSPIESSELILNPWIPDAQGR